MPRVPAKALEFVVKNLPKVKAAVQTWGRTGKNVVEDSAKKTVERLGDFKKSPIKNFFTDPPVTITDKYPNTPPDQFLPDFARYSVKSTNPEAARRAFVRRSVGTRVLLGSNEGTAIGRYFYWKPYLERLGHPSGEDTDKENATFATGIGKDMTDKYTEWLKAHPNKTRIYPLTHDTTVMPSPFANTLQNITEYGANRVEAMKAVPMQIKHTASMVRNAAEGSLEYLSERAKALKAYIQENFKE
jgi:hypothetical protein